MLKKGDVKGLFIPIITPMKYGEFDKRSMKRLIDEVDSYVDGFVPCLSSGEGQNLSGKQWEEVVSFLRSQTQKPIIAGVKRETYAETLELVKKAQEMGCDAYIAPVPSNDMKEVVEYFNKLSQEAELPIMIYNTETQHVSHLSDLQALDSNEKIIAIKDSSMNKEFFGEACKARLDGGVTMNVLQGMEHQLDTPEGCDGYLVSLLNVEPRLVREYFEKRNSEDKKEILRRFMSYNLGSDWYVTLKALLYARGTIASSEQVQQFIDLGDEVMAELRTEVQENREFKIK